MEGLEQDKVEEIAAQMDGEVTSMSGSHGNLSDRSHHGIVGRVESGGNNWFSTSHLAFHIKAKHFLSSSRGVFGINISHQCHRVKVKMHDKCD